MGLNEHERQMENCQHVWVYSHRVYETLYMKCSKCGLERPTFPGEMATRIAKGLKIRHDGQDGDV